MARRLDSGTARTQFPFPFAGREAAAADDRMKWGVLFNGDNLSLDRILRYARMAEEAGADSLWSSDLGRDAFTPLAAISGVAKSARLGTAVATFARPPMYAETAAMTMAELTGGNFVLGLGTAPPAWNADWHGLADYKPVSRMRDYVQSIRKMWSASPTHAIDHEGAFVAVRGYRRFIPAPYPSIPIYLAAVQGRMLELAGEVGDGVLANTLNTPAYFRDLVRPRIAAGMARAGRAGAPFETAALKVCAVHEDRERARALAKRAIAFYATLDYFDVVLDPAGFTEQKERIRAAHARNNRAAMLDAVTGDMIDALALAGDAEEVRAQLAPFEGLIDTVILTCPIFAVEPEETRANHEAMIRAFAR